jgi:predicted secreted protein
MPRKAFCPAGSTVGAASIGDPATFTPFEGVTKISVTGQKRETDDITDMDSTSQYREFLPTIKVGGVVQLDVNFAPGYPGQAYAATLFESGDTVNFKITLPNARGTRSFAGFISDFGNLTLPVDKKATSSISIQVTGPYVDAFAS